MSKKSYKRNQNRLYREIKRRIIAEQQLLKPVQFVKCERKFETLKIRSVVPHYAAQDLDFIKHDMATKIARKLIEDGYVAFFEHDYDFHLSEDEVVLNEKEVEARLDVLRPIEMR